MIRYVLQIPRRLPSFETRFAGLLLCSKANYSSGQDLKAEAQFKKKLLAREKEFEKNKPEWKKRDTSIRKRYGAWNPTRKLSRQQMQDIRSIKEQMPTLKTIDLANMFSISPESIRRILNSKWQPTENEEKLLVERAQRRKLESKQRRDEVAKELKDEMKRLRQGKSFTFQDSSINNTSENVGTEPNKKSRGPGSRGNPGNRSLKGSKGHISRNKREDKRDTKPFVSGVADRLD
ncbi:required for respiratory growth protein 9, mitochondrial [Scheffersomyces xylosifermentans]|uniref:required for respiratory growth protein 9, mitochondrial n=1 Tax=Scheffersomyces xylosifermentans TaxID=1304137 RepID=UPI00315CEE28